MKFYKLLYGSAFLLVLPILLIVWARAAEPNIALPVYGSGPIGTLCIVCGAGLMIGATRDLWRLGGGLPMNAFPPPKLVLRGTFRWIPHPIYTGFVMVCLGASMALLSVAGLWLITPAVALACSALVLGYERIDLERRFGQTLRLLPADDETRPSNWERIRFLIAAVIPWVALYEITIQMRLTGIAFQFGFEETLPVYAWAAIIYESSYLTAVAAPWCARTRRDLRQLTISVWVATAVVFPFYWIVPSSAPRAHMANESWMARLLLIERAAEAPVAAFPSFHVLWAIFVARLYRPRWIGVAYVVAISASCVATRMHYIPDVIAAFMIAPALAQPQHAWQWLRALTGHVANSWREWRIGPVRIINHAFYAGAAAFVQVAIVAAALRPGHEWKAVVTAFAGLLSAGIWAQWVEGSSRLRRPFGFYGGLIAVGAACMFFEERWVPLAANCLAAPWLQADGRVRCLVNGCCHGAPTEPDLGIRVTHPRSRVTRIAKLDGVPIHPTQLYSILSNAFLGSILARLWLSGCPLSLICGVYAIGNGCARFVEEGYRGEPQTRVVWGLRLYQWIAAGSVCIGALLTSLRSTPAPALAFTNSGLLCAAAFALLSAAAMGMDFPESNRLFARLT
jgi:protein-S-isoprenylcysteine O-methyltransferase Ste14